MNRRHFFGAIAAAVAGAALDPERALWRPGARRIFIPRPTPVSVTVGSPAGELTVTWASGDLRAGEVITIVHRPSPSCCPTKWRIIDSDLRRAQGDIVLRVEPIGRVDVIPPLRFVRNVRMNVRIAQ